MSGIDRKLGPALRYDPASVGMRQVAVLDAGGGYDWATMAVWRDLTDGGLYYHADSGCSCWGFADGIATLSQLTRIDLNQAGRFADDVRAFVGEQNSPIVTRFRREDVSEFLSEVADAMADELLGVDTGPDPDDVPADPDLEAAELDRYHRWCARHAWDPSDVDNWDRFVEASHV